jgi:hypothetical protein
MTDEELDKFVKSFPWKLFSGAVSRTEAFLAGQIDADNDALIRLATARHDRWDTAHCRATLRLP